MSANLLPQPLSAASVDRKFGAFIATALLLSTFGCSAAQDNRLPVFPTKGELSLGDKAVKGAWIVLHPKDGNLRSPDGKAICPHGRIGSDGTFVLTSYETNDGAPAGQYAVTLELRKVVKYSNGAWGPGPNLVPKQYTKPSTSPLVVQIAKGPNELPPMIIK
jgi:hypothetical protein